MSLIVCAITIALLLNEIIKICIAAQFIQTNAMSKSVVVKLK